jgi:hypothetical protein
VALSRPQKDDQLQARQPVLMRESDRQLEYCLAGIQERPPGDKVLLAVVGTEVLREASLHSWWEWAVGQPGQGQKELYIY